MAPLASAKSTPRTMPPTKTQTSETEASQMEKTPVTRAATANWKETTPDASLSRHSPWRSVFWSLGISTRLPRVVTATASVGPRAAAKAKAAAKGIEGTSQWVKKPTTSTMSSTRPSAKAKTGLRWRQSAFLSDSRASQYSSGAIKNSRKNSGSKTDVEVHGGHGKQHAEGDLHKRYGHLWKDLPDHSRDQHSDEHENSRRDHFHRQPPRAVEARPQAVRPHLD